MFNNAINYYSIIHLVIYFTLAFIFPNEWILIVILSIIWEILEYGVQIFIGLDLVTETTANHFVDILFNLSGYLIGMFAYNKIILNQ
jgi:hypothetical protein